MAQKKELLKGFHQYIFFDLLIGSNIHLKNKYTDIANNPILIDIKKEIIIDKIEKYRNIIFLAENPNLIVLN